MAKGIRSKVKQRYRSVKRQELDVKIEKPRAERLFKSCQLVQNGKSQNVLKPSPKNAFLHPDDPSAVFPRYNVQSLLDMRSEALPGSGWAGPGNRRKLSPSERESLGIAGVPAHGHAIQKGMPSTTYYGQQTVEEENGSEMK